MIDFRTTNQSTAEALDWVSATVCSLPSFTTRAALGAAWNTEESQRHRAHMKVHRASTLEALVKMVTERRDQLPPA